METTRTLSGAQVLNRTQSTDEPSRRPGDAAREQDAVSEFRLLIGGKLVEGAGDLDVINPATGKKVMASAAGTIKRLTLELGGNDAAIVLEDADPKEVAPKIFAAATLL